MPDQSRDQCLISDVISVWSSIFSVRAQALEAVKAAAPGVHAFEGRVSSGDQFIASHGQKDSILSSVGGLCCEMEGAAIAQVCSLNGTPFVIIRAISDKADDSEEMSYA